MKHSLLLPSLSLLIALATASVERTALADTASPSSAAVDDNARARALYRQATEAFENRKPDEALAGFKESWSIRKTHDVALSMGQVELVLKKYRDAAEHLDFAIRHFPPMESAEMLETARNALAEAKQQVGTLAIKVNRPGAEISVDSQPIGTAPLDHPVYLEPGQRVIAARDPSSPAPSDVAAQTSPAPSDVASQTVMVEAGREQSVSLHLAPRPVEPPPQAKHVNPVPLVVGGLVGLAGIGVGTGFAIAAGNQKSHADSIREDLPDGACKPSSSPPAVCDDLRDAVDAHDRNRNISTAGFIVGGVAILGTVTYWLIADSKSEGTKAGRDRSLMLHAAASKNQGGLWLSGTW
jgi:hypothetical protein